MTDPADDAKRPLLNLGCGPVLADEPWVNADSDTRYGAGVAHVDPLDPGGLPWPDDYFRGTVANHVLQMIPWPDLVRWLREVRRVTDGPVRLLVPDFSGAVDAWRDGDTEWFPISDEHETMIDGKIVMYLTQAGASRSFFTGPWLLDLCSRAGFGSCIIGGYGDCPPLPALAALDSRPSESLIVTAW